MKLSDCEIVHGCWRGTNGSFIVGNERISQAAMAGLFAEFAKTYGDRKVAYFSKDDWQTRLTAQGPLASRFVFDEANDIVTIDGVKVTGALVDAFIKQSPEGTWFRVDVPADGKPVISKKVEEKAVADLVEQTPAIAKTAAPPADSAGPAYADKKIPELPKKGKA